MALVALSLVLERIRMPRCHSARFGRRTKTIKNPWQQVQYDVFSLPQHSPYLSEQSERKLPVGFHSEDSQHPPYLYTCTKNMVCKDFFVDIYILKQDMPGIGNVRGLFIFLYIWVVYLVGTVLGVYFSRKLCICSWTALI